jgi:glyceraldehyde 3-phosphate dehydrogenase
MSFNIAINGFGRIGRTFFRAAHEKGLNIVAINDLVDLPTLVHLLKYDSTYGIFSGKAIIENNKLMVDGNEIKTFAESDPKKLPWKDLQIDLIIESTGIFTDYESASQHIEAGAKRVLVTAPCKGEKKVPTYVLGINEEKFNPNEDLVISMASCTTNCLTPVADVLNKNFGIKKALMSTRQASTMDQKLQDAPHKDLRRARATPTSIIPTTTGATQATGEVIPDLQGKMDGVSLRVPTATVSLVDFTALLEKDATKEEINEAFVKASKDPKYQGSLAVSNEQLVSIDFKGNPAGSIVDLPSTQVVGGNLIKVLSWYDNEMGYSYRLAEFCKFIEGK